MNTDDIPLEVIDDIELTEINGVQCPYFPKTINNKWWRLNNLYYIKDKEAKKVLFKCNKQQQEMFEDRHSNNLILKARQFGCTTFWVIYMLDDAIFEMNMRCVFIAHDKENGREILEDKVKYAWEEMDSWMKDTMLPTLYGGSFSEINDTKDRLSFSNSSFVRVTLSSRSGTCNILHISEFGKICAQYPAKAKEIVTGALESVAIGQTTIIESTAEGQNGYFFQYSMRALELVELGAHLTQMDYKLFFFAWWQSKDYMLSISETRKIIIPEYLEKYFEKLKYEHKIELLPEQKAWYCKKLEKMQSGSDSDDDVMGDWDDMKREYPSYPREAFEQSVQGAYFNQQFSIAYKEGRIGKFPHQSGYLVDTWWDLGRDNTCIWFSQTIGRSVYFINFWQAVGEGLPEAIQMMKELQRDHHYVYGRKVAPHDIVVREWLQPGQKTRFQVAADMGVKFDVAPKLSKDEQIAAARRAFSVCHFDEKYTAQGLKALKAYRKKYDPKLGVWTNPLHNWASHPSDAFMVFSVSHRFDGDNIVGGNMFSEIEVVGPGAWS